MWPFINLWPFNNWKIVESGIKHHNHSIIYKSVKYIDQTDNSSWCVLGFDA